LVLTAHHEFHRGDSWHDEWLAGVLFKPRAGLGQAAQAINQSAHPYRGRSSYRATPRFRAQMARKLDAIANVGAILPHSKKGRARQIAQGKFSRDSRRDNDHHLRRAYRHIIRERDPNLVICRHISR
jgi:hypothetical protein